MTDKRAGLGENPIRIIRKELKLTQKEFADACGIHVSGLYLIECAAYSSIFPSILSYISRRGYDKQQVKRDYRTFIKHQREKEKESKVWTDINLSSLNLLVSPFYSFRTKIDSSRASFCKRICVQPALVFRLENGDFKLMPSSIEVALREVGVPNTTLQELNEQIEEYYFGRQSIQLA